MINANNAPKIPVPFAMEKKVPLKAIPDVYAITMPIEGYGLRVGIGYDRNMVTYHPLGTPRDAMERNNGIETIFSSITQSINGSLCPSTMLPGQEYLMALWSGTGYDPATIEYHQLAYNNLIVPGGVNTLGHVWNSLNNYYVLRLEDAIESGQVLKSGDTVYVYAARSRFQTNSGQKKKGVLSVSPNVHISRGICDKNLVTVVKPLAISNKVYTFSFQLSADDVQKKEKFYVNIKAFEGRRYDTSLSWCVGTNCVAPSDPWSVIPSSTSDAPDNNNGKGQKLFGVLSVVLFIFIAFV